MKKVLTVLFLVISTNVFADSVNDYRDSYYVTLGAGYTFLEKDEEVLGQQLYEARVGKHISDDWSVEVGFGGMPDVRRREFRGPNAKTLDGDTSGFRFVADALYHFDKNMRDETGIDPYMAFGGGIIHYNKSLDDGHTDLFLSTGVGAFIDINEDWFFKPDYRVAMVGHDTEVNQTALFSLGYRWGGKNANQDSVVYTSTNEDIENVVPASLAKVYFNYDSSILTAESRAILDDNIEWINNNLNERLVVEGHCDERGTGEYNLALGARRAQSVYEYLVSKGVDPQKLKTVSYGEEVPAINKSTDYAWSKNRRVEFALDGKGTQL